MVDISADLEKRFGFKSCFGSGEELKRATATLSGALVGGAHEIFRSTSFSSLQNPTLGGSGSSASGRSLQILPSTTSLVKPNNSSESASADLQTRELAFAAKAYAASGTDRPETSSFDALYNHALVLQELAGRLPQGSPDHLAMLQEACDKYEASLKHRSSSHAALYNWGVALTDLARDVRDRPQQARGCLALASHKYAEALWYQPGNAQALNNWGLVLQELCSSTHQLTERDQLVTFAIEKFRHAIRLRPSFDRGCYNLGTVFYTYASALQSELTTQFRGLSAGPQNAEAMRLKALREAEIRATFLDAAQYICLAYALQQHKEIYRKSLSVVKPMLQLPYLRAGYLLAPVASTLGGPDERWQREWFVLDHRSFRAASNLESSLSYASSGLLVTPQLRPGSPPATARSLVIKLAHILEVRRCADPSLPLGHGFLVQMVDGWGQPHGDIVRNSHASGHSNRSSHASGDAYGGVIGYRGRVDSGFGGAEGGDGVGSSSGTGVTLSHGSPQSDGAARQQVTGVSPGGATGAAAGGSSRTSMEIVDARASGSGERGDGARRCRELYFVAEDAGSADAWVDALLLCKYLVTTRGNALAEALAPAVKARRGG